MAFDINNLRLKSILDTFGNNGDAPNPQMFNPMGDVSPSSLGVPPDPTQSITGPPTTDPTDLMNPAFRSGTKSMFTPNTKTEAEDRFNALLAQYPQHTPDSLGRKIVAAMAGIKGGPDASQKILDQPFNQQEADWKNQMGPAYQSANLERQGNINERQLAAQQNATQIAQQRADDLAKKNQNSYEVAQMRAGAYDFKMRHPDWKFDFKGPNILAVSPDGKQTANLGPTGHLSDTDKINLEEQGKEKVANINAGARVQAAGVTANAANSRSGQLVHWTDENGQDQTGYANPVTHQMVPSVQPGPDGNSGVTDVTKVGTPPKGAAAGGQNDVQAKIQDSARNTLDALGELIDEKGKLRPNIASVVGVNRLNPLRYLPGTGYVTAEASIKRLKSVQILDLIEQIKAQSKIGATGFGRLTDKDLQILGSAATKLDTAMPEADFEAELNRIKKTVEKVLQPKDGLTPTVTQKKMTPQNLWDEANKKKDDD